MSDYEPLTRRLTKLTPRATKVPESVEHTPGAAWEDCERCQATAGCAEANAALAAPAHEYAAVALACAALVAEINPHDDAATWEASLTTIADLRDALDALQKVMVP